MCGRYVTSIDAALEREFHLTRGWVEYFNRYNVSPTQRVPVVVHHDGQREGALMRFGLVPFFARGEPGPYSTINARIETLRTTPAFRTAWKRGQRCLVIAKGFYEWQVVAGGKQPWYIHCADQPTFAFAGLWDSSTPPAGEPLLSCTIITLPASPLMARIHNMKQREPAILRREDHEAWLTGTPDEAFACLQPYPDELLSAWPVSKRVNSPVNDDPSLVESTG
jgi:putative SOS response-associated peptidase YedK